jgi:eukaryotic-like serine/threonine-protein kinase
MADATTDRNLLFGILALQMDFIKRDALVTAMEDCAREKDKPIGQVLQSQGALAEDDDALLESLVRRLMEKHDHNARRSLAAVTTVTAIRHELEKIGDADPDRTLDFLPGCAEHGQQGPNATTARFQLLRFHAKGGLGEVWLARDTELHREVALKQIQEPYADNRRSQARFLHEAEVTGRLEHRGIVPVYSVGRFENGRPFYAMRFVSGTSLKDAIAKFHEAEFLDAAGVDRSLELRRLLSRFVDVCNTVAYAHSRGVLHRDLKPGNIILDEYGETLVVDWGLAKTGAVDVDSAVKGVTPPPVSTSNTPDTRAGMKMGTPGYMSPEQASGRLDEIGPASDVYSLGATLYCLLTGKPAFEGGSDASALLPKVCAGDFPRPREVKPTVPAALEAICLKAMAVFPDVRYASARALGEEIERWLADQPVLAYPEPFPARVIRWVRRRKQWVAAAALVLILTVLGLAIHNLQITRERDRLAMTQDALSKTLRISGAHLAAIPNTEKLREYLAQLLLDRCQQIIDKFGTDPGIQSEIAHAHRVIGGIGRLTGQVAKSQASYEKAIQLLTTLCKDDPRHADYRRWLMEVFSERGELNHMYGRTTDAENDFQAALGHADKLRSEQISLDYRRATGSVLINLSEILVLKCQHAEARTAADRAVELLRPLAGPDALPGSTTRDRWLLSMALADRGVASKEAGDRDRAAHDFDEAARVADAVAKDDECYDDSQFELAVIANQRGELLSTDVAKLRESEQSYEQAAQILTRLISNHELIPHYREEMAATLCGRAGVRLAMSHIPDAQRDCEAALDQLSWLTGEQTRQGAPENPQYLSLLGQILDRQSRIQILGGRSPEGRTTHALAVEKLSRAIELDPARATDKVRLEQLKAHAAQLEQ